MYSTEDVRVERPGHRSAVVRATQVVGVVGVATGLLVGGVAPAAVAAPAVAVPTSTTTVPVQIPGEETPPPPTCETNRPPVPDPDIVYCTPRERALLRAAEFRAQVIARVQRAADRTADPWVRARVLRTLNRVLS